MKSARRKPRDPDLRPEYDFRKGRRVRGKYADRVPHNVIVVTLAPDVARIFPDAAAANAALRVLADIVKRSHAASSPPRRASPQR